MKKVKLDKGVVQSLIVMATVVEARDVYTGGHIWRVSQYAKRLAELVGLNKNEIFIAEIGGLVHDVGKIAIPDSILNKEGRLTDSEYQIIQSHTEIGNDMLKSHPMFEIVSSAIYGHHMRVDGKGYPVLEETSELELMPKIIAIADAFDAMTSKRSYRDPIELTKVKTILESEKNKQFDGALVDQFIHLLDHGNLNGILGYCDDEHEMLSCIKCGPIIEHHSHIDDGQLITCPACKGQVIAHQKADAYEFEFVGIAEMYIPKANKTIAENYTNSMPRLIKVYGK